VAAVPRGLSLTPIIIIIIMKETLQLRHYYPCQAYIHTREEECCNLTLLSRIVIEISFVPSLSHSHLFLKNCEGKDVEV
jgi:hypothetical protein